MWLWLTFIVLIKLTSAGVVPPCGGNETLVEIEGDFARRWVSIYNSANHRQYGTVRGDYLTDFVETGNGALQGCLSKTACFMAVISYDADPDNITFKQDGKLVESRFSFPLFLEDTTRTFVEFGDCVPVCKEGSESLFEFDVYVGYSTKPDWWVQDTNANHVLECEQVDGRCVLSSHPQNRFYRIRHCIPSNQCHSFIAGDEFYNAYVEDPYQYTSFNLTVDGELLASREGFRFESIRFGTGCEAPVCEIDIDTLFQIFTFRPYSRWSLPDLSILIQDDTSVLFQGTLNNDHELHYYQACFPRDSCLNLAIYVPETYTMTRPIESNQMETTDYIEDNELKVVFDNITFYDSSNFLGNFYDDEFVFQHDIPFGTCHVNDLCNSSEFLLNTTSYVPEDEPDRYQHFNFFVRYMNDEADRIRDPPAPLFRVFDGFMAGSTYRAYHCIPSDECTEFVTYEVYAKSFEYTLVVNGETREERRIEEQEYGGSRYIKTTLGGDNCPTELSSGAIAGIVIGGLAAVAIIAFAGFKLYRRREGSSSADELGSSAPEESNHEAAKAMAMEE